MSGRQGGKAKPLKAPKKKQQDLDEDDVAFKAKQKADAAAKKAMAEKAKKGGPLVGGGIKKNTLESYVDAKGQLNTTRLIVKTGRLPNFIKPLLGNNLNSWIIEKSVIDPHQKVLYSYTSNLDHRKFIRVEEFLKYKSSGLELTSLDSRVKFSSNLFGFKEKIEKWSHNRFSTNIEKSRLGLQYAMMRLKEKGGLFKKERLNQPID
ncbi:Protein UPS1, mitochondrial [Candida viswanathii]|uniref:Protein UPS1, mitochondrial n=1 Tax=Candida viswanathii TaxID=5486 RepID=A0A367YM24_9ASCO|nr:Protein UPS1, mitochondrial [Candida viswanathii]